MTHRGDRSRSVNDRRVERWLARRAFDGTPDTAALAGRAADKQLTIGVALPALNEEPTIGAICESIRTNLMPTLVTDLVVIDGNSTDATARTARSAGARVVTVDEALPHLPAVAGKGEALWRSLQTLDTDLICWIDADIENFEPHFVTRLVAPLIDHDDIAFVKATYRRPLRVGDVLIPDAGGRVTELLARPLLQAFFPELSGIRQPLAGEYAGRRDVLTRVPFFTGYSVEAALLIDLLDEVGLDAIAQADLGERIHRNRPLEQLTPMARSIARTIMRRAAEWGRVSMAPDDIETLEQERPPMRDMRSDEAAV
jgi:glucosyl-3-phosphoglycerate synthase